MLHLCKRLQAVLELTPRGEPVADIGCDHGRLACALLQRGAPWVTAVDISEPSLEKARRLADTLTLSGRIIARQGDGLEGLEPGIGAVVIAGLSAHTIRDILCRNLDMARRVGCLILQPMQDMEGLRRSLMELGFSIDAEDMVYENRRYYPMLRAVPGWARYTEDELDFGPRLLADRHPLLPPYLLWRMRVIQRAGHDLCGQRRMQMDKQIVRLEGIRQNQLQIRPFCG